MSFQVRKEQDADKGENNASEGQQRYLLRKEMCFKINFKKGRSEIAEQQHSVMFRLFEHQDFSRPFNPF